MTHLDIFKGRFQFWMFASTAFVTGFYAGRISLRHLWLDSVVTGLWVLNCTCWYIGLSNYRKEAQLLAKLLERIYANKTA